MKKIRLLSLATMLLLAGTAVNAQTVDDIVNRYIEAMGGKEKLSALKTVKMTGTISGQGGDIATVVTTTHMVGTRVDMEINGTSNYQTLNTKTGWVFMPVMQMTEPKEMDAEQHKMALSQLDIQGALFNYKDKGTKVEYVDSQKVNKAYAYKLKLTYKNGVETTYFIDTKTARLVKTKSTASYQGQEMEIETVFSDYKQNADGYWFPYSIASTQGSMSFDKVETNIPVDEKIYSN